MAWPRGWDRHRRSDILTVRDGSSAKWLWDIATLAILPVVLLSLAVNTFSYYHYPRSAFYVLCTATLLKGAYHAAILLVVFVEPLLISLLSHEKCLLQIVSMGISIILREGKLLSIEVVVPIEAKETGESLHDKLAAAGGPLLLEVLDKLEAGTAVRTRQNDEESCYAKMLTKDLGKIDWNKDAASIERLIRGLNSWPSAYTAFHDKTLKIWDADVEKENGSAQPGTVAKVTSDAIYVQTGEGLLKINEVQIQGKKRMPVKAFLLGHKVEEGTLLGENA